MLKQAAAIAEHHRRKARDVRRVAQKLVKTDANKGVVGTREGGAQAEEVRPHGWLRGRGRLGAS